MFWWDQSVSYLLTIGQDGKCWLPWKCRDDFDGKIHWVLGRLSLRFLCCCGQCYPHSTVRETIRYSAPTTLPAHHSSLFAFDSFFCFPHLVHPPAYGTVLPKAFHCLRYAIQDGFNLDSTLPENQLKNHDRTVPWDNGFIPELRSGLSAFKICMGWPIFWLCMALGAQVSISQAGQMETHGIPNDLLKSVNPIAYVVFGLVIQGQLYPLLHKRGIVIGVVNRITLGFVLMAVAMAYGAAVQAIIYHAGPCYEYPLKCPASENGTTPNQVHVLLQLPLFVVIALAEVFCWPTGSEYTYSHAPKSMKSILQACYISTAGLGYALSMAMSPLAKDPLLVILWGIVAGLIFMTACVFRAAFRKY